MRGAIPPLSHTSSLHGATQGQLNLATPSGTIFPQYLEYRSDNNSDSEDGQTNRTQ
jgi:hypothetical protein